MPEYMRNRSSFKNEEENAVDNGDGGFFCRFTFGQFFALLVIEVFTLFFVFYLGAKYGQELLNLGGNNAAVADKAGVEMQKDADSKVLTTADPEAASIAKNLLAKADTPELKDRITKMFEEAGGKDAAKTPPVVEVNRLEGAKPAEEPPAVTGAETAPNEQTDETAKAQQDTPQVMSAGEDKPQETQITGAVKVKSGDGDKYSIQVGSYPSMDEASKSAEKWKTKGYSAYTMIANIPSRGKWYRVRIGGFGSHGEADRYLKEFKLNENVEAIVVLNEQ